MPKNYKKMNSYGLLTVNDIELYHADYGHGVPLLLLHGNGEDSSTFEEQVSFFSRYYRVITIDSRGQGKSTRNVKHISYEAMASDVLQALDALKIPRCLIIGFSDGGIVALELAMRAPGRIIGMVIVGANYKPHGLKFTSRCNIRGLLMGYSILSLFSKQYVIYQKLMRLMLEQPHMEEEALSHINTPTLVVVGDNDMVRFGHTRKLASLLPNSQLEVIPYCSHFVLRDRGELFNQMALDFLKKLT